MNVARHLVVTGKVQGVGFRAFVTHEAERLGINGWARNGKDGTVEAVLIGEATAVDALVMACCKGPPQAKVDHVMIADSTDDVPLGFAILPTV